MRTNFSSAMPVRSACHVLTRGLVGTTVLAISLLQGAIGLAQDPFEELRIRISQLEKDNRDLRTALSKSPETDGDTFVPMISELPPMPTDDNESNKSPEDRKMESLVEGLIKRMDEAQNKKIAALEKEVKDLSKKPKPTSATGNFANNGLIFTSADGNFKTHLGGTAQLDFIAPESVATNITTPGGAYTNQDTTTFRRLRMRADGTMYGWIDWVSEFDFAASLQNTTVTAPSLAANGLRSVGALNGGQQGGNTINVIQPTTVWMTFKDTPVGNIRVGNQQDWFSIEHITSARYLDFMERASIMDVFAGANNNGYTPGVSVFGNTDDKMAGLQLGIYKANVYDSGYTFDLGNSFEYGGRVIYTPYYDEESNGRYLVHTGFGAQYRSFDTDLAANQNGENVRIRSRGDLRIVSSTINPNYADTGNFFASGQALIDPEIAVVWGPWKFQGEYGIGWMNGARTTQLSGGKSLGSNVMLTSGYAEALYTITGENAVYNRQTGAFNQFIPKNNVNFSQCTYGAWQVGARYDYTNLNAGLITGGRNQAGTLGLNWWINPNIRFQFNVVGTYINNAASPVIAGPVGSAATGTLQGSKYQGEGLIMGVGTRMDISF